MDKRINDQNLPIKDSDFGNKAISKLRYALNGFTSSKDLTEVEARRSEMMQKNLFAFYKTYKGLQDRVDDETSEENLQALKETVEFVATLAGQDDKGKFSNIMNLCFEQVASAANHYDISVCSRIIVLEDALRALDRNGAKCADYEEKLDEIKSQQERFIKYTLNDENPVDQNADLFTSKLVPMMLAYHGYKVDSSFVNFLYDELQSQNLQIPQSLTELHSGKNEKILAKNSNNDNSEKIKQVFEASQIDNLYMFYLNDKTYTALENLNLAVETFVTEHIETLENLQNLTKYPTVEQMMTSTLEIQNNVIDKELISNILASLSKEEKGSVKYLQLKVLEAPFLRYFGSQDSKAVNKVKKDIDSLVNAKALEGGKACAAMSAGTTKNAISNANAVKQAVEQNTAEQFSNKEADVKAENDNNENSDVVKPNKSEEIKKIVESQENLTADDLNNSELENKKSPENQEKTENDEKTRKTLKPKNVQKDADKTQNTQPKIDDENSNHKEVADESIDDIMVDFASRVFMNQNEYDLQNLAEAKVEVVKRIFGEEIKTEQPIFVDVLSDKKHVYINGQDVLVPRTKNEIFVDVRNTFASLDKTAKKALVNGLKNKDNLTYVEVARQVFDDMIKDYDMLPDDDKKLIEDVAKKNSKVAKALSNSKIKFAMQKNHDKNMVAKIMQKYKVDMPVQKNDEQVDEAVSSFFSKIK